VSGESAVTSRTFNLVDQQSFAQATGDWNPIHVDPVFARRTVAGAPVVHGVHLLLWTLNCVARQFGMRRPTQISASFDRFMLVGQSASLTTKWRDEDRLLISVEADGVGRCSIDLIFKDVPSGPPSGGSDWPFFAPGKEAIDRPVAEIGGLSGHVPAMSPMKEITDLFPQAASWLGADVVATLGATTRLVGMVCPGLHSIFKGLRLTLSATDTGPERGVYFTTGPVRHGLVNMAVVGGGMIGTVSAVVRAKQQSQPAMADIAPLLLPDAFAGDLAVVVGASRGLGEATAKILAAGGAHVLATWSEGEADAERVADEIRDAGGRCTTFRYRIGDAAAALSSIPHSPTHGYYFAAPMIAEPASQFFDVERLRNLERFFLSGFWEFASEMRAKHAEARLFYPSTVYVERWPKGLAEYAMAKAAGELLCTEINAQLAPLTVIAARLPKLQTDQTAVLYQTEHADSIEVLLPLVNKVQRG